MAKYKIAWLPGDGIGIDVMRVAREVLDALQLDAEYIHGDIGWEVWCAEGDALPQRTVDLLKSTTCALFGAITSKPKEEAERELQPQLQGQGLIYRSPIVRLRQMFNLATNLRPCKAYKGNPLNYRDDIDLVVFRENTEDLYAGVEFYPLPDAVRAAMVEYSKPMAKFKDVPANEIAVSCRIITHGGSDSIVRAAFKYAKKHGYKNVTVVEKPNVIRETSGLMLRTAREVAKEFPGIELWEANIDAMCMWLIKNPQNYGVIATSNLFGDIISDLCAQLVGGMGFASSGNIGQDYAVFEPTHGSAPKYSGLDKVNPLAMLLSVKLMLDWLGESQKAGKLEHAIAAVIAKGEALTYDMGGNAKCSEMGKAVIAEL
jgi:isocitrate/isopropylmalate dehydrogenase